MRGDLDECLAWQVLCEPDDFIGASSVSYLDSYLSGASSRAQLTAPGFPDWRLYGVLQKEEFYLPLVMGISNPLKLTRWADIDRRHFSEGQCFETLRTEFMRFHAAYGFIKFPDQSWPAHETEAEFWQGFAKRPGMYMGRSDGWGLYCFLSGMANGGDWLGLPKMTLLETIFSKIKDKSEQTYGSSFAAFRYHNSNLTELLIWAGLREGGH